MIQFKWTSILRVPEWSFDEKNLILCLGNAKLNLKDLKREIDDLYGSYGYLSYGFSKLDPTMLGRYESVRKHLKYRFELSTDWVDAKKAAKILLYREIFVKYLNL